MQTFALHSLLVLKRRFALLSHCAQTFLQVFLRTALIRLRLRMLPIKLSLLDRLDDGKHGAHR
jgi:hypothetical protein